MLAPCAGAATVDPRSLVLRTSEVPSGFVPDADTGTRTNADLARTDPRNWKLIAGMGRVTGYLAGWDRDRTQDSLVSSADLFRAEPGARRMLALYDNELRRAGIKGLRRHAVALGDGGGLWDGGASSELAFVGWRRERVFGYVAGWGIRSDVILRLARLQDRRIAKALG
jgi:hypothetical protein